MPAKKLWLKAGTAKNRKFIPVHDIVEKLSFQDSLLDNLSAFHAFTGSDVTSYIAGHSKKSAWKVFTRNHHLVQYLGNGDFTDELLANAEQVVCNLYNMPEVKHVDEARSSLFLKVRSPESLPPSRDALYFHLQQSHYQAMVWRQAYLNYPQIPPATRMVDA